MRRAAVVVVALLAAACSGRAEDAQPAPTTGAPSTTATTPATTTTTAPAPTTTSVPPTTAAPAAVPARPAPVPAPCELPGPPAEPWPDRPRYTASLTIDPGASPEVTGAVDVVFTPDEPTDRLVFRLWPNAPRLGRAGGRFEITAAFLAGQLIAGIYEPGGAGAGSPGTIFSLPGSFPAGQPVEARLEFRLFMPGPVNDRVTKIGSSFRLGSVLPILSWIRGTGWQTAPAVDAFAEAAASEVADYDVTVTVPPGFTVLATGVEEAPGRFVARVVRDWAATVAPMRTAETTAQGGRTVVVAGVADGASGDPAVLARRTADALDRLSARFGGYPYPRLSVGVTTNLTGGIEFPMHIHLGAGVANIHLVHEVAHQYFYAVVGNDQYQDPWLDEGLATYAEARVTGRLAGQRARAIPVAGRGRLGESMAYWSAHRSAYFGSVYVGGLQALGAFADRLGSYEALDCGLRRYHSDRAYTLNRPVDLFDALLRQTGVDPRPTLAPFGVG